MGGDVFVRFRIGRTFDSEVWAVLLHGQPVDLTEWTVRAEADVAGEVVTWTPSGTGGRRLILGTTALDEPGADDPVSTSTVQLHNDPAGTDGWAPFSSALEVIITRTTPAAEAWTVLSGFVRGDDRRSDDEASSP